MTSPGFLARGAAVLFLAASCVVAFATMAPDPREAMPLGATSVEPFEIRAEQVLPAPAAYIREERFTDIGGGRRKDLLGADLERLDRGGPKRHGFAGVRRHRGECHDAGGGEKQDRGATCQETRRSHVRLECPC